jgi:hypothetical protein
VYHGSPHKFDKFDSSKIGTGEGAQAFGHGLYFAESPDVARMYSADRSYVGASMSGKPASINYDDPVWIAQTTIDELGEPAKAKAHLEMVARTAARHMSKESAAAVNQAIDLVSSGRVAPKGSVYKVDLPDERIANMLDWDLPLSRQPAQVQKAWNEISAEFGIPPNPNEMIGITAVRSMMEPELRKRGVPGVRYLDQGSRGSSKGTRNFVVFPGEEGLLRILDRN